MALTRFFSVTRHLASSGPSRLTKVSRTFSSFRGPHLAPVATRDDSRRLVHVTWDNGKTTEHPYTWLKDSCQCEACADSFLEHRRTLMQNLDLKCTPTDIRFDDSARKVHITWNDEHRSEFRYQWLADRCHSPEEQLRQQRRLRGPSQTYWNETFQFKFLNFDDVMNDQLVMYDLLCTVQEFGVCVVTGAPGVDATEALANKIAYPNPTYYGFFFDVKNKSNPNSLTYTPAAINTHTDIPCYNRTLGVQLLQCVEKKFIGDGKNQLVDGFYVIEQIRKEDPAAFKILTEVPVQFRDYGTDYVKDYYMMAWNTTVALDKDGKPCRVSFSNHLRDHYPLVPSDQVDDFYRAYKLFDSKLIQHAVTHEQEKGQILVLNNSRILHGRNAFQNLNEDSERHLRGCYINWDEVHSRIRRIKFDNQLFD